MTTPTKSILYNYSISIHHNFRCVSGGVVLIPGLCCLKFLFACNTQLRRVVMCFEIRWIEDKHTRVVPDCNISCLTVSSIHPAFQMLQLPINIRGKGLEILTPALPATPPTVCLPSVYLLPCMWSDIPDLLPLYHIFVYYTYDERLVRTCGLTPQEWLLLITKSTSQRIQA